MTDRHLLLPLIGASETTCAQCDLRTYYSDPDTGSVSACPLDGSDRKWSDARLPECMAA